MDLSAQQYKLGISHIDEAHAQLYTLLIKIKELCHDTSLSDEQRYKKTKYILNRLLDYTVTHFVEEEYLMELHRCPGRHAHKRAHRKLERVMILKYRAFQEEGVSILNDLVEFLEHWWKSHILSLDQEDLKNIPDSAKEPEKGSLLTKPAS